MIKVGGYGATRITFPPLTNRRHISIMSTLPYKVWFFGTHQVWYIKEGEERETTEQRKDRVGGVQHYLGEEREKSMVPTAGWGRCFG